MPNNMQMHGAMEPLAVSIDQLAAMTGFGRTFLWAEVKEGRLVLRHKGRRAYVLMEDAKVWLRSDDGQQGGAA